MMANQLVYLVDYPVSVEERAITAITFLYGLERATALTILQRFGLQKNVYLYELDRKTIKLISNYIETNYLVERLLKLEKVSLIERRKKQYNYKAVRWRQGLPVNGQRTHSNAGTAKRLLKKYITQLSTQYNVKKKNKTFKKDSKSKFNSRSKGLKTTTTAKTKNKKK